MDFPAFFVALAHSVTSQRGGGVLSPHVAGVASHLCARCGHGAFRGESYNVR